MPKGRSKPQPLVTFHMAHLPSGTPERFPSWLMTSLMTLLPFANNFGTLIYVVFLACIFVELFLNKECTYLDDFFMKFKGEFCGNNVMT